MSLKTSLPDIKKEETEFFNLVFFQSPISFVPEESHIDEWDKKELVLVVNPNGIKKKPRESQSRKFPL